MPIVRRPLVAIVVLLLLTGCAGAPKDPMAVSYSPKATVAVWDLEDFSSGPQNRPDLGEFISARVIETIQETGGYTVVERQRLLLALEELNIGSSALADEITRLEIGRIVGAKLMVFGGFQVIGDKMRLDLRLVEVETGAVARTAEKTVSSTNFSGWLKAAEDTATDLFKHNN